MIYLDNAATTKPLPCAVEAFNHVVNDIWGNPNSSHEFGQMSNAFLKEQKETLADLLGCCPEEIYFTSGATEACNWAVQILDSSCKEIYRNNAEHHAVLDAFKWAGRYAAYFPTHDLGICHMLANNETGEIRRYMDEYGSKKGKKILYFADGTSYIGHLPFKFYENHEYAEHDEIDYLAFGAHKFGGITGIGALVVRQGKPIYPFIVGGGQQGNNRAGTESVALIAAMVAALKYRYEHMEEHIKKCIELRDALIKLLLPVDGAHLNGKWTQGSCVDRLPDNVNISFRGVEGSSLVNALDHEGIIVSSGSACNSKDNKPSHVLKAMGLDDELAMGAIRITLSGEETIEDIVFVADTIRKILKNFQ